MNATQLDFTTNGSQTSNRSTLIAPPQFSITFDSRAQQYALVDAAYAAKFGVGEFTGEASLPDFYPRVEFARHGSAADDFLVIFKPRDALPIIPIRYGAYGAWQHNSDDGSGRVRLDYFIYGLPTPIANMPHSGGAQYHLVGTGNFAQDNHLWFASGNPTVGVDFSTGAINGSIGLSGTDFFGNNLAGLPGGGFLIGTINGNTVDAAISEENPARGHFHLQFFGPNAEELAITYDWLDQDDAFVGAAIGTRQN